MTNAEKLEDACNVVLNWLIDNQDTPHIERPPMQDGLNHIRSLARDEQDAQQA